MTTTDDTTTTWVPVDPATLKPGDRVRVTHENGDLIHGTVSFDGSSVNSTLSTLPLLRLRILGYMFERLVPPAPVYRVGTLVHCPDHQDVLMRRADSWYVTRPDGDVRRAAIIDIFVQAEIDGGRWTLLEGGLA